MNDDWKSRVLELTFRTTEAEDLEFVRLVETATDKCDFETCKVLMKTFVNDDDFGVQESVVSTLSTATTADYQIALLEELPRLLVDAPEWADVLVEREISNNPDELRRSLVKIAPDERSVYEKLAATKYPNMPNFR